MYNITIRHIRVPLRVKSPQTVLSSLVNPRLAVACVQMVLSAKPLWLAQYFSKGSVYLVSHFLFHTKMDIYITCNIATIPT